jgi:hypothetical protein
MVLARVFRRRDDLCPGQPQFVSPTLDVQPWWPTLPSAGQRGWVQAQR